MKVLTDLRKNQLRDACKGIVCGENGGPALTRKQIRSAVRLYSRHGTPQTVCVWPDLLGFIYSWSFIGIERDGYAHS